MTIVYCAEQGCDRALVVSQNDRLKAMGVAHTIKNADGTTTRHIGHLVLRLPSEPWDPTPYATIENYRTALQQKYPKNQNLSRMEL